MDIYEAIRKMRIISDNGDTFSLSFMSYSFDRDESHGIVTIENAKILGNSINSKNRFSDYMLNIIDMDTYDRKSCWKLLLLEFNGNMLELN